MESNSSDDNETPRSKLSVIKDRALVWFISSLILFLILEGLAHTSLRLGTWL